jgi:serralysin
MGFDNIDATGNATSNILTGNNGNNVLDGGSGGDTLLGGAGTDSLLGGAGADTLDGGADADTLDGGAGADTMRGGGGDDTYVVDSANDTIDESVAGSSGTDTVQSSINFSLANAAQVLGTFENLTLTGTNNISATGNAANNMLVGNAGNNLLNGGTGNDSLTGGLGADTFFFNTALNSATNVDTISDFSVPDDTIRLENEIFTALGATGTLAAAAFHIGAAAADASDHVIYNSVTGALIYDSNGSAAGGAVQFATIGTGLALTNADFAVV